MTAQGVSLSPCQNDFQWCFWVPAKCNSRGVLDISCKNAHDLAVLGLANAINAMVLSAGVLKTCMDEVVDAIVRHSDHGCYVSLWGEHLMALDESPSVWGAHVLNPEFTPVMQIVFKMKTLKQTTLNRKYMDAIHLYLKEQLSVDYGLMELQSLRAVVKRLKRQKITCQSFRLLPREGVANPIPFMLLQDQRFETPDALERAISQLRTKKPLFRNKIVPAIFVSPESMMKIKSSGFSAAPLIEIHS